LSSIENIVDGRIAGVGNNVREFAGCSETEGQKIVYRRSTVELLNWIEFIPGIAISVNVLSFCIFCISKQHWKTGEQEALVKAGLNR